ncbi:MAG: hypothetical protein ACYDEQ_02165 [Desulfocucumaceae bacterium]
MNQIQDPPGMLKGSEEIMAQLRLPWAVIMRLAEFEGLPLVWETEIPTLRLEELEHWQAKQEK